MNMQSVSIPLDQIVVGQRLRALDEDNAQFIADSFLSGGQITPIEVRRTEDGYVLVAGAHRLRAAEIAGWAEISAVVFEGDELAAELREIDENLVRRELSALDRSRFLVRRRDVHEALYPNTRGGKAGAAHRWGYATNKLAFAVGAVEKLGISESSIRRALVLHTISAKVYDLIARTPLANNAQQLEQLAKQTTEDQLKIVKAILREKKPCATVMDARREVQGETASVKLDTQLTEMQLKVLVSGWKKAGDDARREFIRILRDTNALSANDDASDEMSSALDEEAA